MNANGRRCRQFSNGHRHLAKICGHGVKGGRPIYRGGSSLSIAAAIERERAAARRQMQMKKPKKGK